MRLSFHRASSSHRGSPDRMGMMRFGSIMDLVKYPKEAQALDSPNSSYSSFAADQLDDSTSSFGHDGSNPSIGQFLRPDRPIEGEEPRIACDPSNASSACTSKIIPIAPDAPEASAQPKRGTVGRSKSQHGEKRTSPEPTEIPIRSLGSRSVSFSERGLNKKKNSELEEKGTKTKSPEKKSGDAETYETTKKSKRGSMKKSQSFRDRKNKGEKVQRRLSESANFQPVDQEGKGVSQTHESSTTDISPSGTSQLDAVEASETTHKSRRGSIKKSRSFRERKRNGQQGRLSDAAAARSFDQEEESQQTQETSTTVSSTSGISQSGQADTCETSRKPRRVSMDKSLSFCERRRLSGSVSAQPVGQEDKEGCRDTQESSSIDYLTGDTSLSGFLETDETSKISRRGFLKQSLSFCERQRKDEMVEKRLSGLATPQQEDGKDEKGCTVTQESSVTETISSGTSKASRRSSLEDFKSESKRKVDRRNSSDADALKAANKGEKAYDTECSVDTKKSTEKGSSLNGSGHKCDKEVADDSHIDIERKCEKQSRSLSSSGHNARSSRVKRSAIPRSKSSDGYSRAMDIERNVDKGTSSLNSSSHTCEKRNSEKGSRSLSGSSHNPRSFRAKRSLVSRSRSFSERDRKREEEPSRGVGRMKSGSDLRSSVGSENSRRRSSRSDRPEKARPDERPYSSPEKMKSSGIGDDTDDLLHYVTMIKSDETSANQCNAFLQLDFSNGSPGHSCAS